MGRWRCKTCGSTNVTAIFGGIVTARLDPTQARPAMGNVVDDFHPHDDGMTPADGSIQCGNCGGGEAIYERQVVHADA